MNPYIELYLTVARLMLLKPSELPTDDMSELNEELGAEVRSLREIVEVNARPGQRSRDTFVKSTRRDSCF
jgi:hypothetical protein